MFSRIKIRGVTANSDNSASNIPPTIKTIAVCAIDTCAAAQFDLKNIKSMSAHRLETQVCAVKSLAATAPAMAGVGKCENSIGTTKNPTTPRLHHHTAATQTGKRAITLNVADFNHFVVFDAARCLNFGSIAF